MSLSSTADPVKGFAKMPHYVNLNKSISPVAKSVLAAILYLSRGHPTCCPTDEVIGNLVGRSRRTISSCLRNLEEHGLIRREATPKLNVAGRLIHVLVNAKADDKSPAPRKSTESNNDVVFTPPEVTGREDWNEEGLHEGERYQRYLCSRQWGVRREAVRKRSGGKCERCRAAQMTAVHHKTYAHKFAEPLEDLLAICDQCYKFLHGRSDVDPAAVTTPPPPNPFASFTVVC